MDARLIFARTAKGEEEFQHRTYHLNPNLRRVLILVDGQSPVSRLIERGTGLADIPTALKILAEEGFISTVEEAARGGAAVGDPKTEIIALAQSLFGAQGAKVIKKIEEAGDSPEALSLAADGCRKFIKLFINENKAEEFGRRAKEILFAATRHRG